ncbi:hypothetical protein O3P69_003331 [Scylla paramamosain]|uniref:CCHC-type domain-containing protein n=1 Tax=Scylla paramamosain TaxID=85552 RepID=A0AAW0UKA9_SCYPA
MEATGICLPPPFLQCPGKPSCAWTDWERQFAMFLVAVSGNDFMAIWKKVLLLHSMGAEAQRVFHSQPLAIKAMGEDDYVTAVQQLRCFFSPQVNIIIERFNFQCRRQHAEAYECSTWESQKMEESACNTSNFTPEEASWKVQKTTALQGKGTMKCNNCGKTGHLARNSQCPACQLQCWFCGKLGHRAESCRSSEFKKVQKCEEEEAILSYSDKKHLGRLMCQAVISVEGQERTLHLQVDTKGEEEYKIVALLDDEDAITDQEIQEVASTDEEILTLKEYLRQGFPESAKHCPQVIQPYFQFCHEMSELLDKCWVKLGIDVVRPIEGAPASSHYVITMVDYRSKWAEVGMTDGITITDIISFLSSIWEEALKMDTSPLGSLSRHTPLHYGCVIGQDAAQPCNASGVTSLNTLQHR